MLTDGYVRWLGLSPQGKYPVRAGDRTDPKKFQTAWAGLESGVDRKAPLSQFYGEDSDRLARPTASRTSSAGASPRARAR